MTTDISERIANEKEILKIYSEIGYDSSVDYAEALGELGGMYYDLRDFDECLEYTQIAIEHARVHLPNRIDLISKLLYMMSECHYKSRDYLRAINIDNQNLEIIKPYQSQLLGLTFRVLHNLASCQIRLQNLSQASETVKRFFELYDSYNYNGKLLSSTDLYTVCYYDMKNIEASVLSEYGEYAKSLEIYNEIYPLAKNCLVHQDYDIVDAEHDMNVAICYNKMGDFFKAEEYHSKVLEYWERNNVESYQYAIALQMLCRIKLEKLAPTFADYRCLVMGDPDAQNLKTVLDECISIQKRSSEILKKVSGKEDMDYLCSLVALAFYYKINQDFENCKKCLLDVINISESNKLLNGKRPHLVAHSMLGDCYMNSGDDLSGVRNALYFLRLLQKSENANFMNFGSCESNIKILLKNAHISECKELLEIIVEISRERLRKNAKKISEENQRNKYWDHDATNLLFIFSLYNHMHGLNLGAIMYNISLLYKGAKLYLASKGAPDSSHLFSTSWKDVKQSLAENEIAIEFIRVVPSYMDEDSNPYYIALSLRYDDNQPIASYLCSEQELLENNNLNSDLLQDYIWGRLRERLSNIESIYFSPMGELNNIAIESLMDFESGKIMSDRYNIHRLSSTRILTTENASKQLYDAVVYGGIIYDSDLNDMEYESKKYNVPYSRSFTPNYNLGDSLISIRGGVNFLKYTRIEAEEIDSLIKQHQYSSILLSGVNANEESFKDLSGKKKAVVHVSTHGFYWDLSEAIYEASLNNKLYFMLDLESSKQYNLEDKALTRSGLLMAGANNILKGKDLPKDVEDGILTAQEIANLDLRGLDLVVLSACKTGMGDISGDGVFGLQRGFKKAGANSILMSLWDVDDEATKILMTAFYKNYLGGMSKRESLLAAQKAVRETPGFEDPEYWAAFILLDGLN